MLEKIITDLKKSLSGSSKKKKNDDENENEDEEETYYSEDDEEGASEESDGDGGGSKSNRMSMIIRVVVIVGLGYMAVDHFFLSAEKEPSLDEMIAAKPKRKRAPIVKNTDQSAASEKNVAMGAKPAEVAPSESTSTETSMNPAGQEPPAENINIMDKEEKSGETIRESSPEEVAKLDQKIDQMIDEADKNDLAPTPEPETETAPKVSSSTDNTASRPKVSMESMIVEDNVYTPPPMYDQLGRGLVYNCKDKYWACVDKPAYVACNKNMKWNKGKAKAQECVVQNIYGSDEDCAKVQKYNISTSQPTTFCD